MAGVTAALAQTPSTPSVIQSPAHPVVSEIFKFLAINGYLPAPADRRMLSPGVRDI
jgi:hypothetical protein